VNRSRSKDRGARRIDISEKPDFAVVGVQPVELIQRNRAGRRKRSNHPSKGIEIAIEPNGCEEIQTRVADESSEAGGRVNLSKL
jgi:hypothetical protein